MSIKRVEINDFLVFKGEFTSDFCPGVNVLIGSNGTGKTTLLKILYWACEFADKSEFEKQNGNLRLVTDNISHYSIPFFLQSYYNGDNSPLSHSDNISQHLSAIRVIGFDNDIGTPALTVNFPESLEAINLKIGNKFSTSSRESALWCDRNLNSVFIPTAEMLSHSRGLLALSRERKIPFDKTELDIIAKAELEPTHEITENASNILKKITKIIGGTVSYDGKDFFIQKSPNNKIQFSFEASGYRKLGLLWRLLRNGLLEPGSILFWDEPENSLNPELLSILVDILLELSRKGIQIFIATHSEILASYFAVNRQEGDHVLFISLYKDGGQVKTNINDRFDLLNPNNLRAEPIKLYEKEIVKGLNFYG